MLMSGVLREPINSFDPEVEAEASRLWKERGHEEFYLIEWKHLDRPLVERCEGDAVSPALSVLEDAEAAVKARRALSRYPPPGGLHESP